LFLVSGKEYRVGGFAKESIIRGRASNQGSQAEPGNERLHKKCMNNNHRNSIKVNSLGEIIKNPLYQKSYKG
jgi:hypothetical protein